MLFSTCDVSTCPGGRQRDVSDRLRRIKSKPEPLSVSARRAEEEDLDRIKGYSRVEM